jgi:hypothetical protein
MCRFHTVSVSCPIFPKKLILFLDSLMSLLSLPSLLTSPELASLRTPAIFVLSSLLKAQIFHVVPSAACQPLNPRLLPREIVETDIVPTSNDDDAPKKRGRPTKRDRVKKSVDAMAQLNFWLEGNSVPRVQEEHQSSTSTAPELVPKALLHQPKATLSIYATQKSHLLDIIDYPNLPAALLTPEQSALKAANEAIAQRLIAIDEEAAAQGKEVGGEGGSWTGLDRVLKARATLGRQGGILGLLEGGGMREDV